MIICPDGVSDIDKRTSRDEWYYLAEKYPQVAFNARWGSNYLTPEKGHRHLLVAEPHIEVPENWDLNTIKKYQTYITYSSKMADITKEVVPTILIKGVPACNSYFHLDKFTPFNEKINGIICLNKINKTGRAGDIYFLREEVMRQLPATHGFSKHVFSREKWGGAMWQGSIPHFHSHEENLKIINKYRFCLCFESTYDSFHSYDFITERIINCFKSKTIPVYYGCYNIEDFVPKHLFIDYRDFFGDYKKLMDHLLSFTEEKYNEMTEEAFKWSKTSRIGSISDLEKVLSTLK